ncbi:bifunctional proline dehydrogenase/L-glutamate gamma-semialdehyde dehydrogenase PutA [Rickettsiales bacterium LUAb2]
MSNNSTNINNILNQKRRLQESEAVINLVDYLKEDAIFLEEASIYALDLAKNIRTQTSKKFKLDNLVNVYPIASNSGKSIMTLAEALIRIKDTNTQNDLIIEKIKNVPNWTTSLKNGFGIFLLSWFIQIGRSLTPSTTKTNNLFKKLILITGNFLAKSIIKHIAFQFVTAQNIDTALKVSGKLIDKGYSFSYDMLGESAKTELDAEKYFKDYKDAIIASGKYSKTLKNPTDVSISIKLSSLHSRYELIKYEDIKHIMYKRVLELCLLAKEYNIPLFIDAEETERTGLSIELLNDLLATPELHNWNMLGFVVQAYQKATFYFIDEVAKIAKQHNQKIYVRLVKGAYWDTEIKLDQINNVENFALFTRKEHTDISYMACAKKLVKEYEGVIFPCFATHNALTVSYIIKLMHNKNDHFEFQCLHGMGDSLYDQLLNKYKVRKYAPVGIFSHLLPYLVRRLLENGANNSFVNQIANQNVELTDTVKNPILIAKEHGYSNHPLIKLPKDLFKVDNRINSKAIDMIDRITLETLAAEVKNISNTKYEVFPIINGENITTDNITEIINPANLNDIIGKAHNVKEDTLNTAITNAHNYFKTWNNKSANERAAILHNIANKMESKLMFLSSILVREAGKSLKDAVLDIREGIDFLRYYAEKSKEIFSTNFDLPSPIGEKNTLSLEGRGVFLCIAPWNFPFAIFIGQIAGALAAGNTVLAKPAEATSLIGYITIQYMIEAGLPKEAVQFIPGSGRFIGDNILTHKYLAGVAFTGSDLTARTINKALASREDAILPLIAETGGQNAMIADSTALLERVTRDVVSAAFQSAGQRCSALRVLYIQEDIADEQIAMIKGAMQELTVGDPMYVNTDIGPVINQIALDKLVEHKKYLDQNAKHIYTINLDNKLKGNFFAPCAYEISSINDLKGEVFGPVLHIIRFSANNIEQLVEEINSTGFGLTFAVHTMLEQRIKFFSTNIAAGNIYINRNQIGAVVGSQPFGGRNKSGTGPKAGGPFYLHRFATEKTISEDITALGGNAELMSKI